MRIVLVLMILMLSVVVTSCGQKGPLFIPQQTQPQTPAPPPPALPDEDENSSQENEQNN